MNPGINHVSIVSRNLDKTAAFLQKVIGCTPHDHEGWFRIPECSTAIHVIELEDAVVPGEDEYFHYYNHVALEVGSLVDVVKEGLKLKLRVFQMNLEGDEHDVKAADDKLAFGLKTVFIQDPDKNLWEFAQRGHSWSALWE